MPLFSVGCGLRRAEDAMGLKLTFLGGVGTVTGSKYLVEADGRRFFVDCGSRSRASRYRVSCLI